MSRESRKNISKTEGEFGFIQRLSNVVSAASYDGDKDIFVGIGDDGAVVGSPENNSILTTDALVDGVHFKSSDGRWYDVGWKSAVSNLSDIAAMGGTPDHALVTIGVPLNSPAEIFDGIYSGMNAAFQSFGGRVVGGDVVSSPTMFINVALTGHTSVNANGEPILLTRNAAKSGDLVCITGTLGSSAGGLEVLRRKSTDTNSRVLIERHFHPIPRIDIGQALLEAGVRCAMDISDGLIGDLEKIAIQSSVNIAIDLSKIPTEPELKSIFGEKAIDFALGGGEDYELVFTTSKSTLAQLNDKERNSINIIGKVSKSSDNEGHVTVVDKNNKPYRALRKGWDHLSV